MYTRYWRLLFYLLMKCTFTVLQTRQFDTQEAGIAESKNLICRFGLLDPVIFSMDLFHVSVEIAFSITRETANFARVGLFSSVSNNVSCNGLDRIRMNDFWTKWTTPLVLSNPNRFWFLKNENARIK